MSLALIGALAVMTYLSRALGLVLMPNPSPRVKAILDRVPAPLFAALAVTALLPEGRLAGPETVAATACALLAAPTRSILWVLLAGLVGYGAAALIIG